MTQNQERGRDLRVPLTAAEAADLRDLAAAHGLTQRSLVRGALAAIATSERALATAVRLAPRDTGWGGKREGSGRKSSPPSTQDTP